MINHKLLFKIILIIISPLVHSRTVNVVLADFNKFFPKDNNYVINMELFDKNSNKIMQYNSFVKKDDIKHKFTVDAETIDQNELLSISLTVSPKKYLIPFLTNILSNVNYSSFLNLNSRKYSKFQDNKKERTFLAASKNNATMMKNKDIIVVSLAKGSLVSHKNL